MCYRYNLLFLASVFCGVNFYAAELRSLCCYETLPKQHTLAAHTGAWYDYIVRTCQEVEQTGNVAERACGTARITFLITENFESCMYRFRKSFYAYYMVLREKKHNYMIEFHDFYKRFSAQGVGIEIIGSFLHPQVNCGIREVLLDHNNLTSFEEVQEKIVVQCPLLEKLSLNYNKFKGTVWMIHGRMRVFSVAHNHFSALEEIRMPSAELVDLRFNNIDFHNTPEASVGSNCTFKIDYDPTMEIEMTVHTS